MNKYEREILEAVAGGRDWPEWRAGVGACLLFLWEAELITSESNPFITEKGRKALNEAKDADDG